MKKYNIEFNQRTGKRIMNVRQKKHYSREELAEKTNISSKFLYEIEMGRKGCSSYVLYRLAASLGVGMDYLVSDEADSEDKWIDFLLGLISNQKQERVTKIVHTLLDFANKIPSSP